MAKKRIEGQSELFGAAPAAARCTSSSAQYSPDKVFRYHLTRRWEGGNGKILLLIMCNPSTASELDDDPTVRLVGEIARSMGFSGLDVCNLFGLRSTDPKKLLAVTDPVGPDNDAAIDDAVKLSGMIVVAWGTNGDLNGRDAAVTSRLVRAGYTLHCFGTTKGGHPKHPLQRNGSITKDSKPVVYRTPTPAPAAAPPAPPATAPPSKPAEVVSEAAAPAAASPPAEIEPSPEDDDLARGWNAPELTRTVDELCASDAPPQFVLQQPGLPDAYLVYRRSEYDEHVAAKRPVFSPLEQEALLDAVSSGIAPPEIGSMLTAIKARIPGARLRVIRRRTGQDGA